jgi:hypothetical protein
MERHTTDINRAGACLISAPPSSTYQWANLTNKDGSFCALQNSYELTHTALNSKSRIAKH